MELHFLNTKNSASPSIKTEILAITLLIILCNLSGTALNFVFAHINDFNLTKMGQIFVEYPEDIARRFFRTTAAIHQISTFLLPCLFFWWFFKRKEGTDYFNITRLPLSRVLIFSSLIFMASMPMVGLLVIAAIPAVSEELFFRGIVQTKLVAYFKNPHWAIWLGAVFFSAFHFQFEGFFPRIVLGAVLGYLYYWSINLWIPIILHFFNNAMLVSAPFFAISDQIPSADTTPKNGK